MKFISHSIAETDAFAEKWISGIIRTRSKIKSSRSLVVGLYGNLGSGKTAFTQAVAKALGIKEHITSPTFVIEKIYSLMPSLTPSDQQSFAQTSSSFTHLIHIDAYRIENSDEMVHLGWDEIVLNSGNIIIVEWPEKIADLLPADHARLEFTFVDETTREIKVS